MAPMFADLGGKLARRLLALLLLAAWLPLVLLTWASLREFESRLAFESFSRQAYRAKASGMDIFGRLGGLRADLEVAGAELEFTSDSLDLLASRRAWRDRFKSLVATEGPATALTERRLGLEPAMLDRLRARRGVVLVSADEAGSNPSLWLAAPVGTRPAAVIWGELRLDWLWPEVAVEAEEGVGWLLLAAEPRRLLASSPNLPRGLLEQIDRLGETALARFEWADPSRKRFQVSYWTVPLGNEFGHPGLTVLVNEPSQLEGPVVALRRYLLLLALGALLLIALIGIRRLRNDLGPLERLTAGARLIADGDLSTRVVATSGDEFAGLSTAFNEMAERLDRQFHQVQEIRDDLERANWGALTALARAVDATSPWTNGHSVRVTEIAVAIAEERGLSAAEVNRIRRGSLVHDVGKIGVPSALLDKVGPLDADEVALLRSHVEKGVRIIEPITGLAEVLTIVSQHHERLDGSGYPGRLRSEEIDPAAALVAVADVFEALTAARPYRSAWAPERVESYLLGRAGIEFDSPSVEALCRIRRRHNSWIDPTNL
jgi:putative nucleotidyltransferase with HDIG domain